MQAQVKYRNLYVQCLLVIVTLGAYCVYWFYVTSKEMEACLKREEPVFLWTLLMLFFPLPLCWYSFYKQGELFEKICPDINRWITFSLWAAFPPGAWMIIQCKLNRMAAPAPASSPPPMIQGS